MTTKPQISMDGEDIFLDKVQPGDSYHWCWADDLMLELARRRANVHAVFPDLAIMSRHELERETDIVYEDLIGLAVDDMLPLVVRLGSPVADGDAVFGDDKYVLQAALGIQADELASIPVITTLLEKLAANGLLANAER